MNKKIILLSSSILLAIGLTACGNNTDSNKSNKNNQTVNVGKNKNETSFKNNVAKTKDFKMKIKKVKVIQPGEKGNDYGKKPVIAFWYSTTNLSGKELEPNDFITNFDVTQDGKNATHNLDVTASPDDKYLDSQMDKIKKNGTVDNAVAYTLKDTKNPVKLNFKSILDDQVIGSKTYNLK